MDKISSYRSAIQSHVVDFLDKEKPKNYQVELQKIIPAVIDQLNFYREEGRFLYPEVYIVDDTSYLKSLGTFQLFKISEGPIDVETAKKAIKKCAPLGEKGWSIYLMLADDKITYGLFSGRDSFTSLNRESVILDGLEENPDQMIICLRPLRDKLISVRGVKNRLLVFFDLVEEDIEFYENSQSDFIKNVLMDVPGRIREAGQCFMQRILNHILRFGHGTLACVIDGDADVKEISNDGIFLEEPVDFGSAILSEEGASALPGYFELICGMLNSDGVTIFTTNGKAIAYNVFLKVDDKGEKPKGGARSRAFNALCSQPLVVSAYMQSQDGEIRIKK